MEGLKPEPAKTMPHDEYLTKTVMPLVFNGMKILASERPQNPLKHLALYLLQNQDKVFKV